MMSPGEVCYHPSLYRIRYFPEAIMADWMSLMDDFFTGLAVVLAIASACFPAWMRKANGTKIMLSVCISLYALFALYVFFLDYLDLEANFFAYFLICFLILTLGSILGLAFEFVRWLYLRLMR